MTAPAGCMVLEGSFAFVVQGLLFMVTVGVLLCKWWREQPQREFRIFVLDGSKQILGAGVMHIWNLVGAITLEALTSRGDQCSWYFLSIVIDTTFGVVVCYYLLQMSTSVFKYDSGHYLTRSGELLYDRWLVQVGHWCCIVSLMKAVCVLVLVLGEVPFHAFAELVLHSADGQNKLKLVVVMIITPAVMNTFQFWVQDTFLKYKGLPSRAADEETPPQTPPQETAPQGGAEEGQQLLPPQTPAPTETAAVSPPPLDIEALAPGAAVRVKALRRCEYCLDKNLLSTGGGALLKDAFVRGTVEAEVTDDRYDGQAISVHWVKVAGKSVRYCPLLPRRFGQTEVYDV